MTLNLFFCFDDLPNICTCPDPPPLLAPDHTLNEAWQLGNRCPKKISTGLSSVRRGVFGVQN